MIVRCTRCGSLARFFDGPAYDARCADCGARCFQVAPVRLSEPEAFRWLMDHPTRAGRADEPRTAEPVPVARVRLDRIVALASDALDACRGARGECAEDCVRLADACADLTQIQVLCGEPLGPIDAEFTTDAEIIDHCKKIRALMSQAFGDATTRDRVGGMLDEADDEACAILRSLGESPKRADASPEDENPVDGPEYLRRQYAQRHAANQPPQRVEPSPEDEIERSRRGGG